MDPIVQKTPTALGTVVVKLVAPADEGAQKEARFEIQVLDQTGTIVTDWYRRGDLVPYLSSESTYLTVADRTFLIDFMDRVRQETNLRVLGG